MVVPFMSVTGGKHLQCYSQVPGPWFPLHCLARSTRAAHYMQLFAVFTSNRQMWHVGRHGHAASGVCIPRRHFLEFRVLKAN